MYVSVSWLREWVSIDTKINILAERLTFAGLEVERIDRAGPALDNEKVVVGKILEVSAHPDADRLQVCKVDVGNSVSLSIVCGAPNVRPDLKTVCAMPDAELPGMMVAGREIRGVSSQGMLCSSMELGLDNAADGILELDHDAPPGDGIANYLDLSDTVIGLELTPNRGDCLGIAGVAREVAALTGKILKPSKADEIQPQIDKTFSIQLDAPEACPRYVGRAICDIDMSAKTPDWMIERLRRSGMRNINPIVDITNYVMHELGQPMHAFDLNRIKGGLCVRMAKSGESLKLLNGNTVGLGEQNLVIADHEHAIALAGIMGGDNSAISNKTRDIYLEAAFFSPHWILGKAREFGMHTDASHRFERGVDYELQLKAMERATELVLKIAGGKPGPVSHAMKESELPVRRDINLVETEFCRIMGTMIPNRDIVQILKNLGMTVTDHANGWTVKPPSWRFDIDQQHDLIEEIGRCAGFDIIPPRMSVVPQIAGVHKESNVSIYEIKSRLVSRGYHEVITYSFVDSDEQVLLTDSTTAIRLQNPITDSMSVMRQTLWPGLLDALKFNLRRQETRVRMFEVGHVFHSAANSRKSIESNNIAALICGDAYPRQWGVTESGVDFFDLKGDLEHVLAVIGQSDNFTFRPAAHTSLESGQCAEILCGDIPVGYIGKLNTVKARLLDIDQEVFLFEINDRHLFQSALPKFNEISRFPLVRRDIALVVDTSVEVKAIEILIRTTAGELLHKLELFDIYREGNLEKNKKSLAFGLTFQSESRNLTTMEVDGLINKIIAVLHLDFQAQLRE